MKNCLFFGVVLLSPSSRAEWVEIYSGVDRGTMGSVSVLAGGVG